MKYITYSCFSLLLIMCLIAPFVKELDEQGLQSMIQLFGFLGILTCLMDRNKK
jgi:hypothetical protein